MHYQLQDYKRSESFFKGYDSTKLFLQAWTHPEAQGTLVITHGQAEHSDCYLRTIEGLIHQKDLPRLNYVAWDLRGHGRSDGLRGYAKDIDDYILDAEIFFETIFKIPELVQKNIFLLAHSLGGLIQTCSVIEKKIPTHHNQIKGQILSSPFFDVAIPVPAWKDLGSEYVNKFIPKFTLGNEITNEMLTRDPEVIREYEKDTYRHNKISAGVYLSCKRDFKKCLSRAGEVEIPTFMMISDNDPIVSSPAAMKVFDGFSSKDKELKLFENGKHELLNDICRKEAYAAVSQFIISRGHYV